MYCHKKLQGILLLAFLVTFSTAYQLGSINNTNGLPPPTENYGKLLFFYPFASRSILMMVMPLAENLAARGHMVTVISSQEAKVKGNVSFIKVDYDFEGEMNNISNNLFTVFDVFYHCILIIVVFAFFSQCGINVSGCL